MDVSKNFNISAVSTSGAYIITSRKNADERGYFRKLFSEQAFASYGLCTKYVDINNSVTKSAGCIRGLHYQRSPYAEVKLVRCIRGEVYDVIVDVREGSPTFLMWYATTLSEDDDQLLYVPKGFAHGVQALRDNSEIIYMSSAYYQSDYEEGVRFDDERIGINWKLPPRSLSDKDMSIPDIAIGFKGVRLESPCNG